MKALMSINVGEFVMFQLVFTNKHLLISLLLAFLKKYATLFNLELSHSNGIIDA